MESFILNFSQKANSTFSFPIILPIGFTFCLSSEYLVFVSLVLNKSKQTLVFLKVIRLDLIRTGCQCGQNKNMMRSRQQGNDYWSEEKTNTTQSVGTVSCENLYLFVFCEYREYECGKSEQIHFIYTSTIQHRIHPPQRQNVLYCSCTKFLRIKKLI